jgi:hypothetical protein
MDEGRSDVLDEGLCHRVGGYREGRQSEARRLHEYGIHGLPQVWNRESSGVKRPWLMGLSLSPASIPEVQEAKGRLPEI